MLTTAARLVRHGRPLRIEEVDVGEPGDGEVAVEMAFAGVNPVDRYNTLGQVAPDGPLPRTLGVEGVGTVDGRWVVLHGHGLGSQRDGTWAGRVVVPAGATVDVPDGVEPLAAAAMGVAGSTAWRTVSELAQVTADDRVLVLGASGGVGSMVVSLTAATGAEVWGQTGSEEKATWIRSQGADEVVVAGADGLVRAAAELRPTVAFDPLGSGFTGAAVELLEPRGRLVIFGTSAGPEGTVPLQLVYRKSLTVRGYGGLIEPAEALAKGIADALEALKDGRLRVTVDTVSALGDVNEALDLLAGRRVRGKLVLDLQG